MRSGERCELPPPTANAIWCIFKSKNASAGYHMMMVTAAVKKFTSSKFIFFRSGANMRKIGAYIASEVAHNSTIHWHQCSILAMAHASALLLAADQSIATSALFDMTT